MINCVLSVKCYMSCHVLYNLYIRARDETGEAACSLGNITDVQKLLARANNTQLFHCLHKV